ncbi:amidohydrolase [Microvirga sp. TS319]|uniref:amidohydrolase n=1 Tax=Microvirga sp. TS319 TaxID=3241165 RepID=UPI00351A1F20
MIVLAGVSTSPSRAQSLVPDLEQQIRSRAAQIEDKLIAWRRDIHQNPELGEQETRTAGLVAEHLSKLGLDVRTGVAQTGVVAVLKGAKPGPVVALRADMDALPVKEPQGLPFASMAKGKYLGRDVDVMHACGHDAHTAILMAVAEVLAGMKDQLPGTVKFIFQPAEEGPSLYAAFTGKVWGAKAMIKEGVLQNPKPDAVFGLHVTSGLPSGRIGYRAGAANASADELRIKVTGKQGHAGYPWRAVDPITTASQIVLGLQTVVSRRTDLMKSPTVVSVSTINGGSRFNIVPETVEMSGTIRTYDAGVRAQVHNDIRQISENIAESANAKAEVEVIELYDPLVNHDKVTARMAPVLERAADGDVVVTERSGASEDFSFFLNEVPGMFFNLGIVPKDQDPSKAAPNHSPNFYVDDKALVVGVRALAAVTVNYLASAKTD